MNPHPNFFAPEWVFPLTGKQNPLNLHHMPRGHHIALGLAISAATMKPGARRSAEELAAYCQCSTQRIRQIEKGAILKLRFRLAKSPDVLEALEALSIPMPINPTHTNEQFTNRSKSRHNGRNALL